MQQGDVLLTIGGTPVARDNWFSTLNGYKQGDRIPVTVRRFHRTVELTLQLGPPELYQYRIEEIPSASAEAKRLRAAWLDAR
jgi:predicted metalloprotease with PDZ domain